jgi:hypothetical protein
MSFHQLSGSHTFSSTSTILYLLFASDHRLEMSTKTSTLYKYVKKHYPISNDTVFLASIRFRTPALANAALNNYRDILSFGLEYSSVQSR